MCIGMPLKVLEAGETSALCGDGQHARRVVEAPRPAAGGGTGHGRGVRIGHGHEIHAVDGLVPHANVVAAHHAQADHGGAQAPSRVGHRGLPASIGPSSAAVSLTAPTTVATSSSLSCIKS